VSGVPSAASVVGTHAAARRHGDGTGTRQIVGMIAAPLVFAVLWFLPTHDSAVAQHAIAIAALMITLFITEAVDHATAGLIGVLLFWATGVAPASEAFSGFVGETPWFLLGAILIGAMAGKSGLAHRIALTVTARTGSSYSRLLLGFIVVDCLLTFLVPSGIARVAILATIATGVVETFGVEKKSNIGRGLFIVITYSAGIFDKMLIAGAASILARGLIQDATGQPVLYSQWFIAYLPCTLLTILGAWAVILWLYPPEAHVSFAGDRLERQRAALGPWTLAEKRCAGYLLLAVTLWMTDFIHHLSPSLVGIAVGLLAVAPRIGVIDVGDMKKLNYGAIWFTAAALTMGRVLAKSQGLTVLTDVLTSWMEPYVTGPLSSALVLYWTGFVYHFFLANETAMLSTSMPVVLQFAQRQGFDVLATGMIWTFASGGKIFVYQSAVTIVGYSYGYFEAKDLLKVGLALTVIESLILLLLVPFYWPLIGI